MNKRRAPRKPFSAALHIWLRQHRDAALKALDYFRQAPVSSLFSMIAIGVALAVPAMLLLALQNLSGTLDFSQPRQIQAFMRLSIDGQRLADAAKLFEERPDVEKVDIITREQSLADFQQTTGLGDALELLPENPLPAVLVIHPASDITDPAAIKALRAEIESSPTVEKALLDADWLQKLNSLGRGLRKIAWIAGLALAATVLLLIHYSLRTEIIKRREEIQVVKLVGGSPGYVRRPFLYYAILLGLAGALFALIFILVASLSLSGPLRDLSALYENTFAPTPSPGFSASLLLTGILLSIGAAEITIGALIREIEPGA